MSKWTLCLFMTLVIVFSSAVCAYAEEEAEETQLNTSASEESTAPQLSSDETTVPQSTVPPTTEEVIPADYPALTVNAISNFFPNATAEYSVSKKQVEVTYSLRCSMNMMNVRWFLYYDPEIFSVSEELNTPSSICPTIGDKAAIDFGEDVISYTSSSVGLYDFSTKEVPFVKVIFDVKELDPEQPVITKFDLTVDVLCASELDPKTHMSDVEKEIIFVSNTEMSQRAIDSVRLSRNTYLTPSNFVQATTAPVTTAAPVTNENGEIVPATPEEPQESTAEHTASTDATSATVEKPTSASKPTEPPTKPEENAPVSTGESGLAFICLAALFIATSVLFVMRKKEILFN